ncbi:hypothetical protein FACS1894211_09690 [Clostridia bacterium]|nr:hypothetical protein FACS1894211_09690 [Clostridia bacterium]
MIYIKLLISIGVFGLSGYYGFRASKRYAEREAYFSELVLFCGYLAGEIGFVRAPLAVIFEKYSASFKSLLAAQLQAAGEIAQSDGVLDAETLRAVLPRGVLKSAEYDNAVAFLGVLGKSDAENQLESAAGFKDAFSEYHKQALADKKKYAPLYWKLGLLGAGAVVLLLF